MARLEPAWAKAALFFRTGHRFGHGSSEVRAQSLQAIHRQLDARRNRADRGDTMEILHAVALCAEENLPLPTWLAVRFRDEFGKMLKLGGATSLDDIFTSKRLDTRTPSKAASAQQDWQLGIALWSQVWQRVIEPAYRAKGIDPAVKAVLAARSFGVGLTKAKRLINMIDKSQAELVGAQTLSRFLEIRRKQS